MDYKYIAIEGNIGAGKTTLANRIASDFKGKTLLEEFCENRFLPKFYQNPGQFAFPLELSFLAGRHKQFKQSFPSSGLIISDYCFYKSLLFAKTNLSEDEYKLYNQFFEIVNEALPKPDLLVYLHLETEKLLKNIHKRGRAYEKEINEAYLKKIQNTYFSYFRKELSFPVLIIDINNIDFVSEAGDYEKLKEVFCKEYTVGTHSIVQ